MRAPLMILLAACTPETPSDVPDPYTVPKGAPVAMVDPDQLLNFPDQAHLVADETTATGWRVQLRPGFRQTLTDLLPPQFDVLDMADEMDGFGTTSGVFLRFSEPMDVASVIEHTRWIDVDRGDDIAFGVKTTDAGATIIFEPNRPLNENTLHAIVVSTEATTELGEPVWAPPRLRSRIVGQAEEAHPPTDDAWSAVLALGIDPTTISHGTVFHTRSLLAPDQEAAAVLRTATPTLDVHGPCTLDTEFTTCEATLHAADLFGEDGVWTYAETPTVQRYVDIPVDVHLPGDGEQGPYPVIIHGHGLGGDRSEARMVARTVAELGMAVVAIDAPHHGEHPTASGNGLLSSLEIFGVSILDASLSARRLRDAFRAATHDKLQLAAAVRLGVDVDGDDRTDLQTDAIYYTGLSLGGVMGSQFLALDPEIGAAYLSVPGGRLSSIVEDGQIFSPLVTALAPPGTSTGDIDRFFPMLQATIEQADPAVWAPYVLNGRRDLLVQQVMDDTIMPNPTTQFLARALGVDHVPPVLSPVDGIDVLGAAPISGNRDGRTAVYMQFERMINDDREQTATHTQIFGSDSNKEQLLAFFAPVLEGDAAVAIDPLAGR